MKILPVDEKNLPQAGCIHSASWRESHRGFCSEGFISCHTPMAQTEYLREEIRKGKQVFLLEDGEPVGIVSVDENRIENLYVLPTAQGKGYGTALLRFAVAQCSGTPTLWVLSGNDKARALYRRCGFSETGNTIPRVGMYEIEMTAVGKVHS